MSALRKSNLSMEAVIKYLRNEGNRRKIPNGAVLGVYVEGKSGDPSIVILPFAVEAEAYTYRDTTVPEPLREGTTILPVGANVQMML